MERQKIFFTSDLHFGHENVLRFDNRPFETVEEMDDELIKRWNDKVGKRVYQPRALLETCPEKQEARS